MRSAQRLHISAEQYRCCGYAARRSAPSCRSHPSSWFQLAKFRLTNLR
jgi:hypothetical protein